jgi:uncharacterized membrane protein
MQINQEDTIKNLKKSLDELSHRVARLESKISADDIDFDSKPEEKTSQETPLVDLKTPEQKEATDEKNADENQSEAEPEKQDTAYDAAPSLEAKIGLYWLSRLGVGFLVVGVSLLIMYSFQYFGEWAKIFTGFAVSGILLSLGEFVDKKQNMRWYGNALAGGGWSLAYFTSYAMHHVDSVKVIDNPITGASLMLLVAGAAMMQSYLKNSELVATLAIILGYLTLGFSELGTFSAVASGILTAALSFMVCKKKWTGLYSIGTLSAFAGMLFTSNVRWTPASPETQLEIILPYWLAATLLPLSFSDENSEKSKGLTVTVAIISAIAAYFSLKPALAHLTQNADACLFGFAATAYSGIAIAMKSRNCPTAASTNSLLALSSIAMFIPAVYSGSLQLSAWGAQLALILWAGFKYDLKSFRWFSYPLSLFLLGACIAEIANTSTFTFGGMTFNWSAINILPSALVFAGACAAFQMAEIRLSPEKRSILFYWYLHLCAFSWFPLVPTAVMNNFNNDSFLGFTVTGWSLQSLLIGYLSFLWKRPYLVVLSVAGLLSALLFSLFGSTVPMHVIPTLAAIGLTFALAFEAKKADASMKPATVHATFFLTAASWLFAYQLSRINSAQDLAYLMAVEMLIYVYWGISKSDVLIRACGVFTACALLADICLNSQIDWATVLPSIAAVYTCAQLYRNFKPEGDINGTRELLRNFLNVAATFTLTSFIGWHLHSYFISCAWAVEGMALLAAGFMLSDKVLRISGLGVFGILILRLLFVDLSGAETIYRIIAFIVAGLMLMLAAYSYNWFSKKLSNAAHS